MTKRKQMTLEETMEGSLMKENSEVQPVTQENDLYDVLRKASACCLEIHTKGRKNCLNNPFCVFGFGNMTTKKEGIYKNQNDLIDMLGKDPKERIRKTANPKSMDLRPVGLKNLGATCYLNVLIQSLFQNPLIRDAILNLVPSTSDVSKKTVMDDVVEALQGAFGHMLLSQRSAYSLSHFTRLLHLDDQEQQDPQEFNKLFMGRLEGIKLHSQVEGRKSIASLLEGKEVYLTTCSKCKSQSRRTQPFRELELKIEGLKSIEQALAAYFEPEQLTGENKYQCGKCATKQNASRHIQVDEAPPVLSIQLMRYVYDLKLYSKMKLKRRIHFEDRLHFQGQEYRLVSVLYHKGKSAHGGHYVAQALNWETGQWWHCDDDEVIPCEHPARDLAPPPAEEGAVVELSASSPSSQMEAVEKNTKKSPVRPNLKAGMSLAVEGDNDNDNDNGNGKIEDEVPMKAEASAVVEVLDDTELAPSPKKGASVKKKKKKPGPKKKGDESGQIQLNRAEDAYSFSYVQVSLFEEALGMERLLPVESVAKQVAADNELQDRELEAYAKKREVLERDIQHRKDAYAQVQDLLPPVDSTRPFHLVPSRWLHQWVNGTAFLPAELSAPVFVPTSTSPSLLTNGEGPKESPAVVDLSAVESPTKPPASAPEVQDPEPGQGPTTLTSTLASASEAVSRVFNDPIDNLSFACSHSVTSGEGPAFPAPEGLGTRFKAISDQAYRLIAPDTNYDFTSENYRCKQCEDEFTAAARSRWDQSQELSGLAAMIDLNAKDPDKEFSKIVLATWAKALSKDIVALKAQKPLSVDRTVNGKILCTHGQRCPNTMRMRTIRVSDSTWQAIVTAFPSATSVTHDSVCSICESAALTSKEEKDSVDSLRAAQLEKSTGLKLLYGTARVPGPSYPEQFDDKLALISPLTSKFFAGKTFFAVDEHWISSWRLFHEDQTGLVAAPTLLRNSRLRCTHGLCLVSDSLRGITEGKCPSESPLLGSLGGGLPQPVIVTETQWNSLLRFYGPNGEALHGVGGTCDAANTVDSVDVKCDDEHKGYVDLDETEGEPAGEGGDEQQKKRRRIETSEQTEPTFTVSLSVNTEGSFYWGPALCMECIGALKAKHADEHTNYDSGTLTMVVLGSEESVPHLVMDASSSSSLPGGESKDGNMEVEMKEELPSRRSSRRKSKGQTFTISVSSNDTLSLVTLKNSEHLTKNAEGKQTLYLRGRELVGTQKTLAQLQVCSGDVLHVRLEDAPDPAGYDLSFDNAHQGQVESGFKGSFLSSSAQCKDDPGLQSLRDACKEMGLEFKDIQICGAYENAKGSVEVALSILTA